MPRRTGYKTRSASTTLILGDPDLGTKSWDTEYDVEFCEVQRREEQDRTESARQILRAPLRTPRSLKKGYVSEQDYEKLDEQYNKALVAYQDVQLQVAALEHRMASIQGNEHMLLRAVEEQHSLINTLKLQVANMDESVGQLQGGVERNKSLLTVVKNFQEVSPSKMAKAYEGKDLHDAASVSKRLEALEAKIGDMADAVVALSRAQELMAASVHRGAGREGNARRNTNSGRQSDDGRPSHDGQPKSSGRRSNTEQHSSNGRRSGAEKIERLPSPFKLSTRSTFWKP